MIRKIVLTLILFFGITYSGFVLAVDDKLMITITPPLIKNNVSPSQAWRSNVKLVNNNSADISIYIKTLDFTSSEELGTVNFLPEIEEGNSSSEYMLSQWINIDRGPILIPAFKSVEIPFTINVPESAEPGGHYAAILAGTRPPDGIDEKGATIKVSSMLASLILLNVDGEIIEDGHIREFSTDKKVYPDPKVNFTVRFENKGNVHIQPRGEIVIYDYFDKEKKRLELNHNSEYGNVLPGGIRKWNFFWEGENGILEMGRYKAELVLAYGDKASNTLDQILYFWVINYKYLSILIGSILIFFITTTLLIRRYIRKAVINTQKMAGIITPPIQSINPAINNSIKLNSKPLAKNAVEKVNNKVVAGINFSRFKKYIISIIIILAIISFLFIFMNMRDDNSNSSVDNTESEKSNDNSIEFIDVINIENEEVEIINTQDIKDSIRKQNENSNEAVINETKKQEINPASTTESKIEKIDEKSLKIKVLNGSGTPGMAGKISKTIEAGGFIIESTGNADNFNYKNTIIKYKGELGDSIQKLSNLIDVEIKEENDETIDADIVIIVGKNYK